MGETYFHTQEIPRSGSKEKDRERKKRKRKRKKKKITYLIVMPKYWGKQMFSLGRFAEVGQKKKTEREEKES